jgi:hypothetical protein
MGLRPGGEGASVHAEAFVCFLFLFTPTARIRGQKKHLHRQCQARFTLVFDLNQNFFKTRSKQSG